MKHLDFFVMAFWLNFDAFFSTHGLDETVIVFFHSARAFFYLKSLRYFGFGFLKKITFLASNEKTDWKKSVSLLRSDA